MYSLCLKDKKKNWTDPNLLKSSVHYKISFDLGKFVLKCDNYFTFVDSDAQDVHKSGATLRT